MTQNNKELILTKEAAQLLGKKKHWLYNRLNSKKFLTPIKKDGVIFWDKNEILALKEQLNQKFKIHIKPEKKDIKYQLHHERFSIVIMGLLILLSSGLFVYEAVIHHNLNKITSLLEKCYDE